MSWHISLTSNSRKYTEHNNTDPETGVKVKVDSDFFSWEGMLHVTCSISKTRVWTKTWQTCKYFLFLPISHPLEWKAGQVRCLKKEMKLIKRPICFLCLNTYYTVLCVKLHPYACSKKAFAGHVEQSARCANSLFSHKISTFPVQVHVLLCYCGSDAELKPKTNQVQLWNGGGERRWEKRRICLPWSVDVGGLCFRNIQISLFEILLVPHFRDLQENVGLKTDTSGNVQQGIALFQFQ